MAEATQVILVSRPWPQTSTRMINGVLLTLAGSGLIRSGASDITQGKASERDTGFVAGVHSLRSP